MPQVVLAKKDHPFMQLRHLLTLHNSHPQRHTHALTLICVMLWPL